MIIISKYNVEVGISFNKSDAKAKFDQLAAYLKNNAKIDLKVDSTSISDLNNILKTTISDMQREFDGLGKGSFKGLESQIDSLSKKLQNSLDFRNLSNIDTSKVEALKSKLDAVASGAEISAKDFTKLKNEINDLGKSDSQIARIQQTVKSLSDTIKGLENKGKLDILSDTELSQLNQARSELQNLESAINRISSEGSMGSATLTTNLNNARNSVRDLNTSLNETSTSTSNLGANVNTIMGVILGSNGIYLVVNQIKELASVVVELDEQLINISRVSKLSGEELKNYMSVANQIAQETNNSTKDVENLAYKISKLGYDISSIDGSEMVKLAAVFSEVADINVDTSINDIVTALKAFQNQGVQTVDIVDSINEVANRFSVDASGLGEGLSKSSASLSLANNTLAESIGLLTAGTE